MMKKNNLFIWGFVLLCSLCLGCTNEEAKATKSQHAAAQAVAPSLNESLQTVLAFTEADRAAILSLSQQTLADLQLEETALDTSTALSLVQYQTELKKYVEHFARLDDQQLYDLRKEATLIRHSFAHLLAQLAQGLGLSQQTAQQLQQQDQELTQQLQQTVEASNTACKALASPEICEQLLALTQLYALQQMAVRYSLTEDAEAQKNVASYLDQAASNVLKHQYPKIVTERLYQRQKEILATQDVAKRDELVANYLQLKEVLQAKKMGLAEENVQDILQAFQQK